MRSVLCNHHGDTSCCTRVVGYFMTCNKTVRGAQIRHTFWWTTCHHILLTLTYNSSVKKSPKRKEWKYFLGIAVSTAGGGAVCNRRALIIKPVVRGTVNTAIKRRQAPAHDSSPVTAPGCNLDNGRQGRTDVWSAAPGGGSVTGHPPLQWRLNVSYMLINEWMRSNYTQ